MTVHRPRRAAAIHLTMAALIIVVGWASGGTFFTRTLTLAGLAFLVGVVAAVLPEKVGIRMERECDERRRQIDVLAKRAAFAVTSALLIVLWAHELATTGAVLTRTSLILLVLWGSGGLAYAYYDRRY